MKTLLPRLKLIRDKIKTKNTQDLEKELDWVIQYTEFHISVQPLRTPGHPINDIDTDYTNQNKEGPGNVPSNLV